MTFTMRPGRCPACAHECREMKETYTEGPLEGTARRQGRVTDIGTTLRFRLSDGTACDMLFCLDCAAAIGPADYAALWRAQLAYEALAFRQHAAPDATRIARLAKLDAVFPLGKLVAYVDVPELRRGRVDRRVAV